MDWIWGQAQHLGNRAFDPLDLRRRRSDGPSRLWRPDMGTDTMSDIPVRNVQRETFNSPTFNGATERAHGRRDMGTDTIFGQTRCHLYDRAKGNRVPVKVSFGQ